MKKSTFPHTTLATLLIFAAVNVPSQAQLWLIDFGATNSFRGASQVGADDNGNTWNSLAPYWYVGSLATANGVTSGLAYSPPAGIGTDSYNGPLGTDVSDPLTTEQVDSVVIDAAALGVLGGSQAAAADYMSSSGANRDFQVEWVNTQLTYDATFYGAFRWAAEDTEISRYSDSSYTNELQSVTLDVGGGGHYNSNTVAALTGFTTATNKLFFQFGTASGTNNGYLNSMALYGYLGYLGGGTTNLNAASPYIANGTYTNGDSRSVDTVIGAGTTVQVGNASGIYYNSTLVMTNGDGTISRDTNFSIYALTGAGNLALTGTNRLTISKGGTYSGTLTMTGGTLTLSSDGALGTGALVLNGGTLAVNAAEGLGTGTVTVASGTTTLNNNGASLDALTGNNNFVLQGGTFQVNGGGKILDLGTGSVSNAGTTGLNAFNGGMQFNGVISGTGTLNWYGSGSFVLGGANTFSGTVSAGANGGFLVLSNVDALQSATLNKGTNQTVSFALAGSNTYKLGGLTGAGNIALSNGNSLHVNTSGSNTYSGVLSDSGGLHKSGAGTLILSGNNTFTGHLTVDGGTLAASAIGAHQALGSVAGATIDGGATLLLGTSNQVNDGAPITLSGGTISRGSGVGEVFGDLDIAGGSTLDFGTGATGLLQFQNYTYNGSSPIELQSFLPGNKLQFLGSSFNAGNLAELDFNGSAYTSGLEGSYFTITAIPEPSAVFSALALLGLLVGSARRGWPQAH
jgi:autotransporter-associated beta strand protein